MTKFNTARSAVAAVTMTFATSALAASESGTEAVGEMQVTGSMLAMVVGGVAVMGIVIWVLIKFLNK